MLQLAWLEMNKGYHWLQAPNNPTIYHLMGLSIQLAFSGWHVIARETMVEGANPFVFAAYREVLSTVLMYCLCRSRGYSLSSIQPGDMPRIFWTGFFSFINVVGALVALDFISADRFAILQPTIPVWATLLSICCKIEPIRLMKMGAIFLAVIGAVVVELGPEDLNEKSDPLNESVGTIVTIAQCMSTAIVLILSKPLTKKYPPTLVTCAYYTVGSSFTMMVILAMSWTLTWDKLFFEGESGAWLSVAYATIVATFYAYNAWSIVVKYLSPSIATVYCTAQPLGTAVLSIFVFGELPGLSEYIGGVLVVAGLFVSVAAEGKEIDEAKHESGRSETQKQEEVETLLEAGRSDHPADC